MARAFTVEKSNTTSAVVAQFGNFTVVKQVSTRSPMWGGGVKTTILLNGPSGFIAAMDSVYWGELLAWGMAHGFPESLLGGFGGRTLWRIRQHMRKTLKVSA